MPAINDDQLLSYNKEGIVPGPDEEDDAFLERAQHCMGMSSFLSNQMADRLPFVKDDIDSAAFLAEAHRTTGPLFDIAPTWIPIFFSNHQLTPWHGGCAWIFQMQEEGPAGAFMQLRQSFRNSPTYLGIYQRDELLAHELSHVGRMLFEEPRYEELLAYRTSRSKFRRYFGAIVQSSVESMLFVIVLFLIFALDIYLLGEGQYGAYKLAMWAKLVPLGMITLASARLWIRHRHFDNCLAKLRSLTGSQKDADAIVYRLADKEIDLFAQLSPEDILKFAKEHSAKSLRWRLIAIAYLKPFK